MLYGLSAGHVWHKMSMRCVGRVTKTIIRDTVQVDRVAFFACTQEGIHAVFQVALSTGVLQDTIMGTMARRPVGILPNT